MEPEMRIETESLPQPWNEDSESGIKRLIEERDRSRELAGKKTAEAEDNLVRAVLAERENARLREELRNVQVVEIPDLKPDGHANRMFVDGYKFAQKRAYSVSRALPDLTNDQLMDFSLDLGEQECYQLGYNKARSILGKATP